MCEYTCIPVQFKQPYSLEEMDGVAYTGRQLNSTSAAVQLFNMAVICKMVQVQMVITYMQECFDVVEVAYWYNKAEKYGRCIKETCTNQIFIVREG